MLYPEPQGLEDIIAAPPPPPPPPFPALPVPPVFPAKPLPPFAVTLTRETPVGTAKVPDELKVSEPPGTVPAPKTPAFDDPIGIFYFLFVSQGSPKLGLLSHL